MSSLQEVVLCPHTTADPSQSEDTAKEIQQQNEKAQHQVVETVDVDEKAFLDATDVDGALFSILGVVMPTLTQWQCRWVFCWCESLEDCQ